MLLISHAGIPTQPHNSPTGQTSFPQETLKLYCLMINDHC
jgi:hypothetical protein